jgi:hypothetical protein
MIMKNKIIVLSFLLLSIAFQGCVDDEEAEIGEPFGKSEGLTASEWVISEVYLVDEGNPSKPEQDISQFYLEGESLLAIDFEKDGSFSSQQGSGLNFFPQQGTWTFDDNDAPTEIILTSQTGEITVAPLGGPTRITDAQLKFSFASRFCMNDGEDKPVLGYRVIFYRKS